MKMGVKKDIFAVMKQLWLLIFISMVYLSCERPEPIQGPTYIRTLVLAPDPTFTVESDTATLTVRAVLSRNIDGLSLKIGSEKMIKNSNGDYSLLIHFAPFGTIRYAVPVDYYKDDQWIAADTARFVRFSLIGETTSQMDKPRSNHASVLIGDDIWTVGGVTDYLSEADHSVEIYHTQSATSENLTTGFQYARSGHGIIYDQQHQQIYVVGGGNRQYAKDGNNQLIATERISIQQPNQTSIKSNNGGWYQDFGYYFDGDYFFIQGGVGKTETKNTFFSLALSDSLTLDFKVERNFPISEQIMIPYLYDNRYIFFNSSEFDESQAATISGFIVKSTGGIYIDNLLLKTFRNEHAAVSLENGFALVSGGFSVLINQPMILNSFELLDFQTFTSYKVRTTLQKERSSHSMIVKGNKIYVLGGYDQNNTVLKSIEIFNYQF